MKVLGIGNAIVDVICKVEDSFLSNNGLTKSTMKLVDEPEFKKLLSNLKIEETISGGSVANSIVGLKPTIGLVSRTGIVPISSTLDTSGPMTKNVIDNIIVFFST